MILPVKIFIITLPIVMLVIYYAETISNLTIHKKYSCKKDFIKALIPFYNWYKIFIDNYNNLPSAKEK